MSEIGYLAIGHVCRDITPSGPALGGSVTFSSLTAHALGLKAALITSAPDGRHPLLDPLQAVETHTVISRYFTTFENVYRPHGRIQTLSARAEPLAFAHVPLEWRSAPIVHLAPVADELDPELAGHFPGALIGVTPQGWMRQWDQAGQVTFRPWASATQIARVADVIIMSIEDVQGNESLVRALAQQVRLLVVTRGEQGCTLFAQDEAHTFAAPCVEVVDPTGAGDIFAAAFLIRLHATRDPFSAARFATSLASASVTRVGLDGIPTSSDIDEALSQT